MVAHRCTFHFGRVSVSHVQAQASVFVCLCVCVCGTGCFVPTVVSGSPPTRALVFRFVLLVSYALLFASQAANTLASARFDRCDLRTRQMRCEDLCVVVTRLPGLPPRTFLRVRPPAGTPQIACIRRIDFAVCEWGRSRGRNRDRIFPGWDRVRSHPRFGARSVEDRRVDLRETRVEKRRSPEFGAFWTGIFVSGPG